jgi:uncharacterized membrane protein
VTEATQNTVITLFESVDKAEAAATDLMNWDKASDDIKLGAIGIVSRDAQGEIVSRNLSSRNTGKGATVGLGVGVLAAVLSGGLTLIPTAIGGVVAGGALGSLSRKGLGLSDDDLKRLWDELDNGRAALMVVCNEGYETEATSEHLRYLGGQPRTGVISHSDLEAAAQEASKPTASTPPAAAAPPAAPTPPEAPAAST